MADKEGPPTLEDTVSDAQVCHVAPSVTALYKQRGGIILSASEGGEAVRVGPATRRQYIRRGVGGSGSDGCGDG